MGPPALFRTVLIAVAAGSGWWALSAGPTVGVEPAQRRLEVTSAEVAGRDEFTAPAHRYVGVASCAAANCHGGDASRAPHAGAYSTWAQKDPHAQAFAVLYNEKSGQIAKLLGLKSPAHQTALCLDCHATHVSEPQLAADHRLEVRDGVGCESCHGPAETWREAHVRFDWKTRTAGLTTDQKYGRYGFIDTKDLPTRARVCAGCHVGSADRQVNHDLVAAGHPPLKFELTAFLSKLPPHWDRAGDKKRHSSTVEAKLWAIGQLVSADAAVALLEARAADRSETAVWPEFAEYDCFACHHDLSVPSWRQECGDTHANRRSGDLAWGTWYFPLLSTLANDNGGIDAKSFAQAFHEFEQTMRKPYPNRAEVAQRAAKLKRLCATWTDQVARADVSAESVQALIAGVVNDGSELTGEGWDAAVQVYLALSALQQASAALAERENATGQANQVTIREELETIRRQLEFPQNYDSPRRFGRTHVEQIQRQFEQIQQRLHRE